MSSVSCFEVFLDEKNQLAFWFDSIFLLFIQNTVIENAKQGKKIHPSNSTNTLRSIPSHCFSTYSESSFRGTMMNQSRPLMPVN